MNKFRNVLIILPLLICSLILFACSEPDINSNSSTDVSSTTTAETSTVETTSAAAKVQNNKTTEKETTSAQLTEQITQTDIETEETDDYADYDDSYYEEDYYQPEYEEPEQGYEQNDDWEDNDYDSHEHDYYIADINETRVYCDGGRGCGIETATTWLCDCGDSYVIWDYSGIGEAITIDVSYVYDEKGEIVDTIVTKQCSECGYQMSYGLDGN